MDEVVVRVKIPKELVDLREKIERAINEGAREIVKKFEDLRRGRGCLKTEKSWEELEAELYDDLYKDISGQQCNR